MGQVEDQLVDQFVSPSSEWVALIGCGYRAECITQQRDSTGGEGGTFGNEVDGTFFFCVAEGAGGFLVWLKIAMFDWSM